MGQSLVAISFTSEGGSSASSTFGEVQFTVLLGMNVHQLLFHRRMSAARFLDIQSEKRRCTGDNIKIV